MSLSDAAAVLGIPEALVERSAAARAAETGASVDEILAAWAGGEVVESAAAPEPAPDQTSEEATTFEAEEAGEADEAGRAAETAPPTPVIETPAPEAEAPAARGGAPARAPVPAEVTMAEAAHLPEVVTVPTAGIKERLNFVIPRWLVGLLLVAPIFALFALGGSATGACGEATELTIDVVSGEIVNCDGSEFTGAGPGGGATDFIALGGDLYAGNVTAAANCAGCHGANGQGGVGPALNGVLTTFGACEDHVQWVLLGTQGWGSQVGNTYGDTNKAVGGGGTMPPHAALTEEQLRAVVAFERARFGGANPDETLVDCGLVATEDGEGGGGEGGEEGEAPGGESEPTGTTIPTEASG
jgi:mono/diheme cytochrome c family protein